MRHSAGQIAVLIKHHSIGPWARRAIKLASVGQNGEFPVRGRYSEGKAFVIVFGVRVVVAADGLAGLKEGAASGDGVVDVVLGVGVIAADGAVGLPGDERGGYGGSNEG
jgi:hypothetical protein